MPRLSLPHVEEREQVPIAVTQRTYTSRDLADLCLVEVDDPTEAMFRPKERAILVEGLPIRLRQDNDSLQFCLDLAHAAMSAALWAIPGCDIDDVTSEMSRLDIVDALRAAVPAPWVEEPARHECSWCGVMTADLSDRSWCPSCEADSCPECGQGAVRDGFERCSLCQADVDRHNALLLLQRDRDEAQREDAEDARMEHLREVNP